MRHRMRGRKLGRNSSHRRALFRNMACSLIRTVRVLDEDERKPKVPGRIITTEAKAKELRPYVEKLVTMARKAARHAAEAENFGTDADRNSDAWRRWRESEQWQQWNKAIAPSVALRRRAFALLRDNEAIDILFDDLAEKFEDRPGGYTRVVRLPSVRLGDAGQQVIIEFVGERDRVRGPRKAPTVSDLDELDEEAESAAVAGEQSSERAGRSEEVAAGGHASSENDNELRDESS